MSLEEAARRTVEGMAGKLLLSAAITIIIGASGWTAHQIYDHGEKLSGISQKIDDLVIADNERARAEDAHEAAADTALTKLADSEQQHSTAIALAQHELEELRDRERAPPHYERESFVAAPPPIVAPVLNALSHIFTPPRGHHRRP